jgi:hypothetical protein
MKIRAAGANLFHVDAHDKANSSFSKCCKCAYNEFHKSP